MSSDATTHRAQNLLSSHISFCQEDGTHATRLLAIQHTINHTADTQFSTLTGNLGEAATIFNKSPLAACENRSLAMCDIAGKLTGMHSDHASDQKKLCVQLREWKQRLTEENLGLEVMLTIPVEILDGLLNKAWEAAMSDAGGQGVWDGLSMPNQHQ